MNWRQKKKKRKYNTTAKRRKRNKVLCERYPFLIPRSVWTDKLIWDKDLRKWSYTLAEDFPRGWWKAFGVMMCEELREELLKYNFLDKYRFVQIKEKYGQLRAYDNGYPEGSNVSDIIGKYSVLSENICMHCGKPDVPMLNMGGWFSPYCPDCYKHINIKGAYEDYVCKDDPGKMSDTYRYTRFSKDGEDHVVIDISETANKIRENWNKRGK